MKKRNYNKPQLKIYLIDMEISLVMMTYNDENNPQDDPFGGAPAPPPPQEKNTFSENPFEEKQ